MTKTNLIFPALSSRFVAFAVELFFCCKFSFHRERRSSQVCQWRDFPRPITDSLLRIVTNKIVLVCIDNRLRQMAFFRLPQSGQRQAFALR